MQPDLERIAVAWAKGDATIEAVAGDRVATRLPKDFASSFLRIVLIDGSLVVAETGDIASGILQFDAYAKSSGASPNYTDASLLARTAHAATFTVSDLVLAGEGQICGFGAPTMPRRIEEPETGFARYLFECSMVARAIA